MSFALYRLPYAERFTLIRQKSGTPRQLAAISELNGQQGFVVAPFAISEACPLVLIRPDEVLTFRCDDPGLPPADWEFPTVKPEVCRLRTQSPPVANPTRADYTHDFDLFHGQIVNGSFRKLVLSRCDVLQRRSADSPWELFREACKLYPRLFVALAYTPQSGLWLVTTPELLAEGEGDSWRTIALAGTMRLEGDELRGEGEHLRWSTKNIEEQRLVGTYIEECLRPFCDDIVQEGPRTVRAAHLVHLRSDFTFRIKNNVRVGDLLQALHPTPAVCGLPKEEALRFILANEHTPRRYYSGFMGPLALHGVTRLYVSLRCMQITPSCYRLYAGGGLLRDSQEEQEWQETEAKMQNMRTLTKQ